MYNNMPWHMIIYMVLKEIDLGNLLQKEAWKEITLW